MHMFVCAECTICGCNVYTFYTADACVETIHYLSKSKCKCSEVATLAALQEQIILNFRRTLSDMLLTVNDAGRTGTVRDGFFLF